MDKDLLDMRASRVNSNASTLSNETEEPAGNSVLPPQLAIEATKPEKEEETVEEKTEEKKSEKSADEKKEEAKAENKSNSEDKERFALANKETAGDEGPAENNNNNTNNGDGNGGFQPNRGDNAKNMSVNTAPKFQIAENANLQKENSDKGNYKFGGGGGNGGDGAAPNGLPNEVNNKMESSLGADFSDVKIHKNSQESKDIGAYAFTKGSDVHFAPGEFKPFSLKGQELIGHELAHVVQQDSGNVKPTEEINGASVNTNKSLEKDADKKGKQAAAGKPSKKGGKKKKPKPKPQVAQRKAPPGSAAAPPVSQSTSAPTSAGPGPATSKGKIPIGGGPGSGSGPIVPAFTLFGDALDIDFDLITGSATVNLDLEIAPLATAVKAEVVIENYSFVSGKLIVHSDHLPGVEFILNVDSAGTVGTTVTIDTDILILGMNAGVNAVITNEGIEGNITLSLAGATAITDSITAEAGAVSFDLAAGGQFTGNVDVKTNDGFATGSAAVSVDYDTGAWSGSATVTSQLPKEFILIEGTTLTLPAGMELSVAFGPDGTTITGSANAQVVVDLKSNNGIDLTGLAVVNLGIGISSSGITLDALAISTTATFLGMEANVNATLGEEGFSGNVSLALTEEKAIGSALKAVSGNINYTFGQEDGNQFTGDILVKTNDGFAEGTASVAFDAATNAWSGTATVASVSEKTLTLIPGTTLTLPSGMEITVDFGPDGTQIQGSASAELVADLSTTDGIQVDSLSVANIELDIDNNGLRIVGLTLDSTTTIFGMEAKIVASMAEGLFEGNISITLVEPKPITDSITAESGSLVYTFGEEGQSFVGEILIKTNDGFAEGTANVNMDPISGVWSGSAIVASKTHKIIPITDGVEVTLPAGMELTVSFGPEGTQLVGDASAQINIDVSTTDGLKLNQVAVLDIALGIDNTGITLLSLGIDSTTTVWGMEAQVNAMITADSITGTVDIELIEPKNIANFLTATSGSISFDFGLTGGFFGEISVVTNDDYAEGTASVSFDPITGVWSGVATVYSISPKTIEVTQGVVVTLPPGIELSVGFGSGDVTIDGTANVLVDVDLTTGSGIDIQGEAEVVVVLSNAGIKITSLAIETTTEFMDLEATIDVVVDENGLTGSVLLELDEPLALSEYLTADSGSFGFDIGTTGLITGSLSVYTNDGFASGMATVTVDTVNKTWIGTATLGTDGAKVLDIAPGVTIMIPAGAELFVKFGSEGIEVQGSANVVSEVELNADSGVQAKGIADIEVIFGTDGVTLAPNTIMLAVTGGLSTPDIDSLMREGHLSTSVDNGAILTLNFGEDGQLSQVDLEATGGFSDDDRRIGRISFTGRVNLNPFSLDGMLHAVSQADLNIVSGQKYSTVLVAGSQFFVSIDEQGVSNIDASLAADLREGEEAIARLKLIGMLPRGQGLTLEATIELLKTLEIIAPTADSMGLSIMSGAALGVTLTDGAVTQIEGTLGLEVTELEGGPLLYGEIEGVIGISDPDQKLSIISGAGTIGLGRDFVREVGGGILTINAGSNFTAEFGEGTLTGIGGLVDAAYFDGSHTLGLTAELDYDVVNKSIRKLDATIETDAEFLLFNDQLKVSELSGGISIRDNEVIAIGGHARLDAEIGDFILAGEADLAWLNSGEGDTKFVGNGWLEFAWSEEGENPDKYFIGRVDAAIDGDNFEILGQIEMGLMKGLSGAASIWIDQEMDPIISASLTYTATLMEADELWSFEQDFGVSMMVFPGIAIDAGIMLGLGIFTRPLMVMGTAGVENWRPKANAFPDFYAEISASWGIDIEAKVLAYLALTLGLGNVLYFTAGIRAGLGLKVPIELNPFITLHGGEDGVWGEVGLNLSIKPILELIIEAYMKWGVLGFWEGDRTFPIANQDLGELGGLEWSGSFAFGDKEESSQNTPQIPQQVATPNATPTVETGDKPDGLGIGNKDGGSQEAEGGLSGLTDGIDSPGKEGEEPEGLGGFGDQMNDIGAYAEGIGAVGDLIGIVMDGFKSFMKGGPIGLIIWILFNKPNKAEMQEKRDKVEAFRQKLSGDVIKTGSTIDRMLGILSGEYSFWTLFNASIPFQKMVDKGMHADPEATIDEIADICTGMIKGWTGEGDESRLVKVLRFVHDNKGNAATREMVDKSGGRKKWEDQFESFLWQDSNDRGHLKRIFNEAYGDGVYSSGNKPTYTAEPGATIEIDGRSKDDLVTTAFGHTSYRYYVDIYNEENNPGLNGTYSGTIGNMIANGIYYLPAEWKISSLSSQHVWASRYSPGGTIEYTHSFETYNKIAQRTYGNSNYGWRIADYNPLVPELLEGSTINLPTEAELGPPWIEVAPVPIGMTNYTLWVTPDGSDIPEMWAGPPDQKVLEIGSQASQIEGGEDAGAQLINAANFDDSSTQFDADTGVAKAAGLIDFLLTSEIFSFEASGGGGEPEGPRLEEAQPGDTFAIGNHEMKEVGEVVYGHEERAAWIEEAQPNTPTPPTPNAEMQAAPLGLAVDGGASGLDPTKTVGQNLTSKSAATQSAKTAETSMLGDNTSSSGGGNTEEPLAPGMIKLPTWSEMHEMDALPAASRGVAPNSKVEAVSSDTWAGLAIKAYGDWEKAVALSDHTENDNISLSAGAIVSLPSPGDLTSTQIAVSVGNAVSAAAAPAGGLGADAETATSSTGTGKTTFTGKGGLGASGGAGIGKANTGKGKGKGGLAFATGLSGVAEIGKEDDTSSTSTEPQERQILPGTSIKAEAGDTWSALATAAYGDFSLFPKLVNFPANAQVKTLPIGEWIAIPTLEELENIAEFGLGHSPNGKPLLTEMVKIPTEEGIHHVWAENRAEPDEEPDGIWMMASDPFALEPEVDQIVAETQSDPEIHPTALKVQEMTDGEMTTAAIDSTKQDITDLVEAQKLANEGSDEVPEFVIGGVPQELVDHLMLREGFKDHVYDDGFGILTAGLGHKMLAHELEVWKLHDKVPMAQLIAWGEANILHAYNGAKTQASSIGVTDSEFINALTSVCFQLGNAWNTIHKNTWAYMQANDWENAALEAADSTWFSQTPVRVVDFQEALRAYSMISPGTTNTNTNTTDTETEDYSNVDTSFICNSVGYGGINEPRDVAAIQVLLEQAGCCTNDSLGSIGPETVLAIKNFQKANFTWEPDGLVDVDQNTWNALVLAASGQNTGSTNTNEEEGEQSWSDWALEQALNALTTVGELLSFLASASATIAKAAIGAIALINPGLLLLFLAGNGAHIYYNDVIDELIEKSTSEEDLGNIISSCDECDGEEVIDKLRNTKPKLLIWLILHMPLSPASAYALPLLSIDDMKKVLASLGAATTQLVQNIIDKGVAVATFVGALLDEGIDKTIEIVRNIGETVVRNLIVAYGEFMGVLKKVIDAVWPVGLGFGLEGQIGATFGIPYVGGSFTTYLQHKEDGKFYLLRRGTLKVGAAGGGGVSAGLGGTKGGGAGGENSGYAIHGQAGAQVEGGAQTEVLQEFEFPIYQDMAFVSFMMAATMTDVSPLGMAATVLAPDAANINPMLYNTKTEFKIGLYAGASVEGTVGIGEANENTNTGPQTWNNTETPISGADRVGPWWSPKSLLNLLKINNRGSFLGEVGLGMEIKQGDFSENEEGVWEANDVTVALFGEGSIAAQLKAAFLPSVNIDQTIGLKVNLKFVKGEDGADPTFEFLGYSVYHETGEPDLFQANASETEIQIDDLSAFNSLEDFKESQQGFRQMQRFNLRAGFGRRYFADTRRANQVNALQIPGKAFGVGVSPFLDVTYTMEPAQFAAVIEEILCMKGEFYPNGWQDIVRDLQSILFDREVPPHLLDLLDFICQHIEIKKMTFRLQGSIGLSGDISGSAGAQARIHGSVGALGFYERSMMDLIQDAAHFSLDELKELFTMGADYLGINGGGETEGGENQNENGGTTNTNENTNENENETDELTPFEEIPTSFTDHFNIAKSVGRGGHNEAADVTMLKSLLNHCGYIQRDLTRQNIGEWNEESVETFEARKATRIPNAIFHFQVEQALPYTDANVGPAGTTWRKMIQVGYQNSGGSIMSSSEITDLNEQRKGTAADVPNDIKANITNGHLLGIDNSGYLLPEAFHDSARALKTQLEAIKAEIGNFSISCGYRSPEHNTWDSVGSTADKSQHVIGIAADIQDTSTYDPAELKAKIIEMMDNGEITNGGLGKYSWGCHYDIRGTKNVFK